MATTANIIVKETVDLKKVAYLIDTYKLEQFYSNFKGSKADAKKEYNKTMKYLRSKLDVMGDEVKYNFSLNRLDGRLYGKDSIQNVMRDVRGFICDGITTDIDLQNAHPVLLFNICNSLELECPNLKMYIDDREEMLGKIMLADNICRDDAKEKVLIATNSQNKIPSVSPYFNNLNAELKRIQKRMLGFTQYDYLKPFIKPSNKQGSLINHILCVEENKLLMLIKECCERDGLKIHALMFDGIMIYGEVRDGFLKLIEDHLTERSGFTNIKLTIKPHKTHFEIPEDYVPMVRTTYDEVKTIFEKTNCKVECQFCCEQGNEINCYSRADFLTLHENLQYYDPVKNELKPFVNEWFKDANLRNYHRMDTYPKTSLCPEGTFNIWKSYPVDNFPASIDVDKCEKALKFFKEHVKVLCDYDEVVYKFVMGWLQQMFQYPEHKTMELVFISSEGAGKGMFLQFLKTIMGGNKRCWECTDPLRDIYGQFNGFMKDAMLVVLNEANKSNTYNKNDVKKALITDNNININIKGQKGFTMNSYHRFITFSNNACPIVPNDRRDLVIRASDAKKGQKDYFDEGFSYAEDIGCCKYIYDYLMNEPCKPKIVQSDIPMTEHHMIMVEEHKKPIVEFMEDMAVKWHDAEEDKKIFKSDDLLTLFKNYSFDKGLPTPSKNIGCAIGNLRMDGISNAKKWFEGKSQRVWIFDVDILYKGIILTP